jgi:hypothetical protein
MPQIPEMTIDSLDVNAEELYNKSIFNASTDETYEILNGRLSNDNYSGGSKSIPAYACQAGSFAAGFYVGFDKDEFVYAEQLGGNTSGAANERVISAGLSSDIWLPFDAEFVMFGVQAFFKQDAVAFIGSAGTYTEYWSFRCYFDDDQISGMTAVIPHNKINTLKEGSNNFYTLSVDGAGDHNGDIWTSSTTVTSGVDSDGDTVFDYSYGKESRYRFMSKMSAKTNVSKGYHSITSSFFAGVSDGNQGGCKLVIPTGGIWALAFR